MNIQITWTKALVFLAAVCFAAGFFGVTEWDMDRTRWLLLGMFLWATGAVLG